jgi:hypothetical protein
MKMYPGAEVQFHTFLTSTLDRGERTVSLLGRFNPRRKEPQEPTGGKTRPAPERAGRYGQENKMCPCQESNPYSLVMLLEPSHYTDRAVQA